MIAWARDRPPSPMKTLVLESVLAGSVRQLQFLLAQRRRIVSAGFQAPADLDVNVADRSGVTPLHTAVLKGNLPMVKLLLESGADCLCPDSLGKTPLDLANAKHSPDIAQAMHAHLSSLHAKSPKLRLPLRPHTGTAAFANASGHEGGEANDSPNATIAQYSTSAGAPWSRSRCAHEKTLKSCGALLHALNVSSVKKKDANAAPCNAASEERVGGDSLVEVPRDAILDFKLWMKQKQAATAPASTLASFSEVAESTAEDEEVCAVNRFGTGTRTACARRSSAFQRPITPTVYGDCVRATSLTPCDARRHSTCAAAAPTQQWLHAPQPLFTSNSIVPSASASRARSQFAGVSGSMPTKGPRAPSGRAAEELPPLPSSFLPRELDPSEAARMQEQRQAAVLHQQILSRQQETRSMTPAAFKKLKRRILGAVACGEDECVPLADGRDNTNSDVEAAAAPSAFRPKLQAGVRLRRLVL